MKNFIFVISVLCVYFSTTADSLQTETTEFQKARSERREPCLHLLSNETHGVNITEDSKNFRCFRTCLIKRNGYLQNGKILMDKYEKMLDFNQRKNKERNMNAAKACIEKAEEGETECDVGVRFSACHRREVMKYFRRNVTHSYDEDQHQHL